MEELFRPYQSEMSRDTGRTQVAAGFQSHLENRELCMWVIADPLTAFCDALLLSVHGKCEERVSWSAAERSVP